MGNLAEETKQTIKDTARHATYLAAGLMTGEEEIKQTNNVQNAKKSILQSSKLYKSKITCLEPISKMQMVWNVPTS
eukprot:3719947-Ditylum_brightwellii.AAC.1